MYDGYVFFCTKATQQQCLSNRRFTCSDQQSKPTEKIKEGSVIFLYNTDDKTLLGPFTALTVGADELDAGAWVMDVNPHVPSEDLQVTWEDLHIIQNAPEKLAFLTDPKTCRLTTLQTQRALDLLREGELYLYAKEKQQG
ncbi:MAG: hypothetical protein NWE98_06515 [Candidatus Bathyarchaeota archaeon]|nr:hypothetical protein [Candidatus Bathyarchaeota archaeon]